MALEDVLPLLLARHRAVLTPPPRALIRADHLMLHGGGVPSGLARLIGDPVPAGPGVARLPLLPGIDVLSLLDDLPPDGPVAPVHLMQAAPRFRGGPATEPELLDGPLSAPRPPEAGRRPVTVAVLDTGIARHPWFVDHPWFAEVGADQFEVLDADRDDRLDTLAGHGTFVAGIVLQHAPGARIAPVRLLGSDGICDEVDLITALRRVGPVDVVNLSLGAHTYNDLPSVALRAAVEAVHADTVLVAAAGNHGDTRPFWPAALPSVIAVAALDRDGTQPAAFTNRGDWVDTSAVGEDVCGPFVSLADDAAALFARWSGTSFAAPAVSGTIAQAIADTGARGPDAIEIALPSVT